MSRENLPKSVTRNFYVYEHIRNDTCNVFYVGKGSGYRASREDNRNHYWKNIVNKANGYKIVYLFEHEDEELIFLVEQERIDQLKKLGVKLSNLTNGGEGASGFKMPESAKRKISESQKGKVISEEMRKHLSEKVKGFKHTEEAKRKISEASKSYIRAEEWYKKVSESKKGYKHSKETIDKISETKKKNANKLSNNLSENMNEH